MADSMPTSGNNSQGGNQGSAPSTTKVPKSKKSRKSRNSSLSSEKRCRWQCVAMGIVALGVPTILALRAMHLHTDSLIQSHQLQSILHNTTLPNTIRSGVGSDSGGGEDWHRITVADLMCYARRYEDIQAVHGFDPTSLLRHYIQVGKGKGLDPFCSRNSEEYYAGNARNTRFNRGSSAKSSGISMLVDIPCMETSGRDPNTCRIRCTDSTCSNAQSLCDMIPRCQSVSLSGNRDYGILKGHATQEDLKSSPQIRNKQDLDLSTFDYVRQTRKNYDKNKDFLEQQLDSYSIRNRINKQNTGGGGKRARKKAHHKQVSGSDEDETGDRFLGRGDVDVAFVPSVSRSGQGADLSTPVWKANLAPKIYHDLQQQQQQQQAPNDAFQLFTNPNPHDWGLPSIGQELPIVTSKYPQPELSVDTVKESKSDYNLGSKVLPFADASLKLWPQRERPELPSIGQELPIVTSKYPQPELSVDTVKESKSDYNLGSKVLPFADASLKLWPQRERPEPFEAAIQPPSSLSASDQPLRLSASSSLTLQEQRSSDQEQRYAVAKERKSRGNCATSPLMGKKEACLPAFLIIGAQKSGTSTLSHLMGQHPQVKKPRTKELLFFNWNNDFKIKCKPKKDELSKYFDNFPKITQAHYQKAGFMTGEWSATYLPCHCCASAVFRAIPKAKIVAILRHPIDRAHSRFIEQVHFAKQYKKREINNCPVWMGWDKFVDYGIDKLQKCFKSIPGNGASSDRECIHHNNEIGWSIYAPSIMDWLDKFGESNVQVVYTDDLKADPLIVMQKIESHINLAPFRGYKDLNSTINARGAYGWKKKSDNADHSAAFSKMKAETYMKLHDFYKPSIFQLQKLAMQGRITSLPPAWKNEWEL